MNETIKKEMLKNELYLKDYATFNKDAIHLNEYVEDMRPSYFRDIDRIIHSSAYTRYLDKTQVFSFSNNDNVTKRIIHVNLVSKLARTIGRALSLNEDLIEVIALGHDLGHVPFGHVGERILNDISLKYDNTYFNHNVQSVRLLMNLENNGKGLNLSLQTLDGILCHNGELCLEKYEPINKDKDLFLKQYNNCYKNQEQIKQLIPMTLEGCVVRICDIIAYVGRDIEDAIKLNIIKKEDIPNDIVNVLGDDNKSIVNTLLLDVINNSINKPYIEMSKEVFTAMKNLKEFNYKYIYDKAYTKEEVKDYEFMFNYLFEFYLKNINNKENDINIIFLNDMTPEYINNTNDNRKVIDYLSGMTDEFFMKQYKKYKMSII